VRFAPSPTGRLHIGGARTALFNWAFARAHEGAFILRVEDTDQERNTQESLDSILDSMKWLGLDWDEGPGKEGDWGPYFQSERTENYHKAAAQGLEGGWLYRCFCSSERITQLKEELMAAKKNPHYDGCCRGLSTQESEERSAQGEAHTLRFAVPQNEEIVIQDHIRGEVKFHSSQVEDWVAVRSGGMPTYNFVCAVDDAAMEISHVIRGEEHLVNTPKQVMVARALGLPEPEFAHVPLILGTDGKKLSKRTGDTALGDYVEKGFPREALFNFLCLLGFSIDDETTVFGEQELLEAFALKRINQSGAIFDTEKLAWLCGDWIRRFSVQELAQAVRPWMDEAGWQDAPSEQLEAVAAAFQERIQLFSELPEQAAFLLNRPDPEGKAAKALQAEGAQERLGLIAQRLEAGEQFPPAEFDSWVKSLCEELEVGMGKVMQPMRAALAGSLGGPPVADILSLLGREESLRRLNG